MTDPAQHGSPRPTNSLAVISLIAGLCGFSLVPVLGSIAAVITGHLALGQIRATGEPGATLARAGLWLGYVAIALLVVLAVVGLLLFVIAFPRTS